MGDEGGDSSVETRRDAEGLARRKDHPSSGSCTASKLAQKLWPAHGGMGAGLASTAMIPIEASRETPPSDSLPFEVASGSELDENDEHAAIATAAEINEIYARRLRMSEPYH